MSTKHLLGAFLCLFLNFNSIQAQIFVDADATGANNGNTWTDAFTDLQSALNTVLSGHQIWVAEGTYFPTASADRTVSFQIKHNIEIYGGFQGGETSITQRDWKTNLTILSGEIGLSTTKEDNTFVIVDYPNTSTVGKLDGLIIQDGNANEIGGSGRVNGAAVKINAYKTPSYGMLQFKNMVFRNNYASSGGGAIYVEAGNGGAALPNFELCDFINNESGSSGGAVYHSAYGGIDGDGHISSTFSKCTFLQNKAHESGAAVFNHGGSGGTCIPSFTHCDFEKNASNIGHGGAMYNLGTGAGSNATPMITNCRFFQNSGFAAGAIYNNGTSQGNSSPEITNSTFVANFINENGKVGGGGGIIYNNGSVGGNSNTIVTNCIIWGNLVDGDDTHIFKNVEGNPTISYSIVDIADCYTLNKAIGSTVNCGAGIQYNVDPKFVDEANGDLRLQDNSPAINAGDNSMNTVSIDLDGVSRIMYSQIDPGAYENLSAVLPVELVDFQANLRGETVVLTWTTLSELNNDYFSIEHSKDGVQFQEIARVNGAGNSNVMNQYETTDFSPDRGINYYRLIQTDFDGTSTKSNIVNVLFEKGKTAIYPNPVKEKLFVTTEEFEAHDIEYGIYDILGQEISRQRLEVLDGKFEVQEVEGLNHGTYIIRIFSKGQDAFVQKFQKI